MSDPTSFNGPLQDVWNNIEAFGAELVDHNQKARFAEFKRFFITIVMTDALAADAQSEVFIQQNRKFLKNATSSPVIIEGNGVEWEFPVGATYACSNLELGYFLEQCTILGIPGALTETSYANWFAGAQTSYFWS